MWTKRSLIELGAILLMTAVVVVVAILQYRWSNEIGRFEEDRLKASLDTSVRAFDEGFSYDFEHLCDAFEVDPAASETALETNAARQYFAWAEKAANPNLISTVDIWESEGPSRYSFESLDTQIRHFRPVASSSANAPLRDFLSNEFAQLSPSIADREAVYYPWTFRENSTALIRPLFQLSSDPQQVAMTVMPIGFLVIEFNRAFLTRQYFPELVERSFGELADMQFGVAIRTSRVPHQALYRSAADFPVSTSSPDAQVELFDSASEVARRTGHAPLLASSDTTQWELVVQHPAGSLEDAVAAWRRRNLTIGFGLLFVLAGSVALVFSVARRASRLAKLQMQFVAGVSHELCTPLAVINSAVENLADGVVDDPVQIHEYATLLRDQGRRMERLVDEFLSFAAGQLGRSGYDMRPVEIGSVTEEALLASETLLREEGFTVVKEIDPALPAVLADPAAVKKCIENLISNAMKYGASNRWIAIRAHSVADGDRPEVQINVEDRGMGIPADELPQIFEPFHRVQSVRDSQIRGVGLGLHLVKRMMDEMGGRVTVSSELDHGTTFVLHFPVPRPPNSPRHHAGHSALARA